MPRLSPVRALRFAAREAASRRIIDDIWAVRERGRRIRADDPLHVLRLYAAPDPWGAVREWEAAHHLIADAPAYYLLELRPDNPHFRRAPVRYLLGAMDSDAP